MKIAFFIKMRCQEATWSEVGSIWVAKRVQNESQDGIQDDLRLLELR